MKVILVIETKDKVIDLGNNNVKLEIGKEIEIISAKPMPTEFEEPIEISTNEYMNTGYMLGWNMCINEILGEEE